MPDHASSDRDVLALLDRAAGQAPPLHLHRQDVVARGEQIRRRRRAGAAGMSIGAVALAGVVWLGSGLMDDLQGASEVSPAGMTWEVDEPETATAIPEHGASVSPLTFTRTSDGVSATFGVDGRTETVTGRPVLDGVQLFEGEHATVLLWTPPEGAAQHSTVVPDPEPQGKGSAAWSGGRFTVDGQELAYWWTTLPGYEPQDIVHHDGQDVWTVTGRLAETVTLRDGDVELTGFALSDLGVAGYVDDSSPDQGALEVVDDYTVAGPSGDDGYRSLVARLPGQAVFAREVGLDGPEGEVVSTSEPRRTVGVGGTDLVLVVGEWQGGSPQTERRFFQVQWSHDALTWHDQDDPAAGADLGPVGPGGKVVLLDETYEVGTDAHGWPQLLDEDGSVFLTVSDAEGPPAGEGGGIVMWREHWWPWSDRNEVHFAVDAQPRLGSDVDGQDAVTVSGPAGVVGLVAVPAGS
ncbi:hypothetical protein [uncultured Ornithinimicrobium sp.]|uniref:hypothetical protein n=1 Tax=uncultured Ornithinimicrobium sp. TaxID=259307 RepID=UPI0025933BB0|nr:hypothetical protein [uncultured Ornithinimicrobium sp.]